MITRDIDAFFARAATRPFEAGRAVPKAVFLVAPEGMALAAESAQDNAYMAMAERIDVAAALVEHRTLAKALSAHVPVVSFPGDAATPDAVFPNNVFATAAGRFVVGHMKHAVRQREAARADIRGFFTAALGYRTVDLSQQPGIAELTGSLVIDRARNLGYCGLSERCDGEGAAAMHAAFGTAGFALHGLPLPEIEKAGGSLRCCVGELF